MGLDRQISIRYTDKRIRVLIKKKKRKVRKSYRQADIYPHCEDRQTGIYRDNKREKERKNGIPTSAF